ncbi:unnamed protein product [Orchesella dallaii]|uniref:Uncharacterized protein n=1 Tax=Orchesella dallaii TaxID=48710 RepID=A0ABP1RR59_9HEXA
MEGPSRTADLGRWNPLQDEKWMDYSINHTAFLDFVHAVIRRVGGVHNPAYLKKICPRWRKMDEIPHCIRKPRAEILPQHRKNSVVTKASTKRFHPGHDGLPESINRIIDFLFPSRAADVTEGNDEYQWDIHYSWGDLTNRGIWTLHPVIMRTSVDTECSGSASAETPWEES